MQEQEMSNLKKSKVKVSFDDLLKNSKKFLQTIRKPTFPVTNNTIEKLGVSSDIKTKIATMASEVRPIAYTRIVELINHFLEFKINHGSAIEKKFYKNMNTKEFMHRLLQKRPLVFVGALDEYVLRDGTKGVGGFELIGTEKEQAPLVLEEYLSYDEMQISALLGVSTPTLFINDGARHNKGIPGKPDTFEKEGIYIGLVGPRLEKENFMEWQHLVITPEQNTIANGYGEKADPGNPLTQKLRMWARFYQQGKNEQFFFPTYDEVKEDKSGNFVKLNKKGRDIFFNVEVYKQRLRAVLYPFLVETNLRAEAKGIKAYVYAVGLGLGVWQLDASLQTKLMIKVYAELISQNDFSSISDLDFAWFPKTGLDNTALKDGDVMNNGIKIHFTQRNPAQKLSDEDRNKLIVAMYAWDGNAFPGNEYWRGDLSASGDPAAACCSLISQFQNPLINPGVSLQNLCFYGVMGEIDLALKAVVKRHKLEVKLPTRNHANFFVGKEAFQLREIIPIHLEEVGKTVAINALQLLSGGSIESLTITFDKSGLELKFANKTDYAHRLTVALLSQHFKSALLSEDAKSNSVFLSDHQEIREFIMNICKLPGGYVKELYEENKTLDLLKDVTRENIEPVILENLSQTIGANAARLLTGGISKQQAEKLQSIANIEYVENKMILKFSNRDYARRLAFVLQQESDYLCHDVKFDFISDKNEYGCYEGAVTISGAKAIKYFIEKICLLDKSYTEEVFKKKLKIEQVENEEPEKERRKSCVIS